MPRIERSDWAYVKQALMENWVSSVGPHLEKFEESVASLVNKRYAVATVNGTSALHIALLALGIGTNEEVLVPSLTFIASVNPIRYVGAWPVFMDAEPNHLQLDIEKLDDFLRKECRWRRNMLINKRSRRRVRAILPVHILGHPVDMKPLLALAQRYELFVIEDAAEGMGSTYHGRPLGSLGDVGCLSFNGNKIITTGGGGMIVTDQPGLAKRARYLTTQARDHPIEYIHDSIGYNYRLSNIQGALGLAQIKHLPRFLQRKHSIALKYQKALAHTQGLRFFKDSPGSQSNNWLSAVYLTDQRIRSPAIALQSHLMRARIQTRRMWKPVHQQIPYVHCQAYRIEWANRLYERVLCLPSSVGLTHRDQNRVISNIRRILTHSKTLTCYAND